MDEKIVEGDTCFSARERYKSDCKESSCKYWIDHDSSHNCALIATNQHKGMTLEQIGDVFGLTRMRVCQIEKNIKRKLLPILSDLDLPSEP